MINNVGSADKIIRLVAGAALIALPFTPGVMAYHSGVETIVLVVVGAVLVSTALNNFCPLYRVLGLYTNHG